VTYWVTLKIRKTAPLYKFNDKNFNLCRKSRFHIVSESLKKYFLIKLFLSIGKKTPRGNPELPPASEYFKYLDRTMFELKTYF
jgi:hypothetical protein